MKYPLPTQEQLANLPPYLQDIILGAMMENPEVWHHLFAIALKRLGGGMIVTEADLKTNDSFLGIGLNTDLNSLVFFSGPEDEQDPEKVFQECERMRTKAGKNTDSIIVDLRNNPPKKA